MRKSSFKCLTNVSQIHISQIYYEFQSSSRAKGRLSDFFLIVSLMLSNIDLNEELNNNKVILMLAFIFVRVPVLSVTFAWHWVKRQLQGCINHNRNNEHRRVPELWASTVKVCISLVKA